MPLHTSHLNLMMHHGLAGYRLILILVHRLSGPFVGVVRVCGDAHLHVRTSVEPENER